ncbi:TetR family transcriptional regulator C-terminal domain-containing protein [Streptomyces sp. 891-h]|uniref:TetR/AcrR family transcriptional regulator n=1 Tax=unclassified Streptomyces TaxID=2593676 RepID=UPI001FAA450B|nr:TetR family transcriptional regulator C-terminal domain-containing protein [Streptomyces sp. 891-h]UNZ20226.1 TetR family transcriptional regulator [Streptomyces sp. 891-h]
MQKESHRRTVLADAAIDVLADEGIRGLTHRAVDRAAQLPPGTTSAYYRTRRALLTALVSRLVERDQAELEAAGRRLPPPRSAEEMASALAQFVRRRLTGEGRRRTLARYACTVESVHHPELREILTPRENAARDAMRTFLADRGVPDCEERTLTLLACVDGLVFDRLVNGGEVPEEELLALLTAALR